MAQKGGTVCAFRGCHSRTTNKGTTLFRFPKDVERSRLWLNACNREDLRDKQPIQLYNNFKVCAKHFHDKMFTNNEKYRLLPTAIPTFNPQFEGCLGSSRILSKREISEILEKNVEKEECVSSDMEHEDFSTTSMNTPYAKLKQEPITIKDEPCSETNSPHSSCPSSPRPIFVNCNDLSLNLDMSTPPAAILKPVTNILLTLPHTIMPPRIQIPSQKLNIKIENGSTFQLPPTPPSCSSSEDNATSSQPTSPATRRTTTRVVLNPHALTKQPISTPLISSQPMGSSGILILTEEEKRTLIAEGYAVPTRLPLTKVEEKALKKIRRKIRNKISAQGCRRKKKEYTDQLEKKIKILVTENNNYRKKIDSLENSNSNLLAQLEKLQAIVARTHPEILEQLEHNNEP